MDALAGGSEPAAPSQAKARPCRIGLSGWNYPSWRRRFYAGLQPRQWLEHCTTHFTGLEINATFYRFMKPDVVAAWREAAPPGFSYAVKGHRFITHTQRLVDVAPLVARQRDSLLALDGRLTTVLWQLPQNLERNDALLERFLSVLAAEWPGPRHAIEFRNASWFTAAVADLLDGAGVANCQSHDADWPLWPAVTGVEAYARFYAPPQHTSRDQAALATKVDAWRAQGLDVQIYFDGDSAGEAPYEALALIQRLSP